MNMEINSKEGIHQEVCQELHNTYRRKNHDYGDSFATLRQEYPNAILIRLGDKYNRLKALMSGKAAQVKDESIDDTLLDLANYCILELVERRYAAGNFPRAKAENNTDFSLNEYQGAAMTFKDPEQGDLNYSVLGLNGEAGEVADALKKLNYHGHSISQSGLIEELGDALWYIASIAHDLEVSLSDVANVNIRKLWSRYPEGHFSKERSINRKECHE